MPKLPWFPFYPNDFIIGTIEWQASGDYMELLGAYIYLLCAQWDKGSVSEDAYFLATRDLQPGGADELRTKFDTVDGKLMNLRLEACRKKQEIFHEKQRENGKLGGRPPNNPSLSSGLDLGKPKRNPKKPNQNQNQKEDKEEEVACAPSPSKNKPLAEKPPECDQQIWDDFILQRKAKKAPFTITALNNTIREAAKVGMSLDEALTMCSSRGWQGFESRYVLEARAKSGQPKKREFVH